MKTSVVSSSSSTAGARLILVAWLITMDERFTSVIAHQAMIAGGVKKKTRRENKGLVDEISATIILQDYMKARGTLTVAAGTDERSLPLVASCPDSCHRPRHA